MSHGWQDEHAGPSRWLPPALLAAAVLLSAWVVPALLRTADHERVQRRAAQAAERLATSTVLTDFNAAMRDIARVTEPSVVHVSVAAEARGRLGVRDYTQSGSGWVWDDQGHVVTNAHVVDGARNLEVQLNDGSLREATLIGMDLRTDIAVLQVSKEQLTPAARSAELPEQGDMVFAFGSPFEFRFSMSSGIVSGIGRSAGLAEVEYENFIQVDAAINPGNSGGPLVDVRGRVIGMNTAIATGRGSTIGAGQFAGIGLAIPMQIVENVVEQIIEHGTAAKGFLGVAVEDVEYAERLASRRGAPPMLAQVARHYTGQGAVVLRVTPDSPAQQAGIREGDVILSVGGRRIARREQVLSQVGTSRPGTLLPIELWRPGANAEGGERLQVHAELGTLDPAVSHAELMRLLRLLGLDDLKDARVGSGADAVRGAMVGRVVPGSPMDGRFPAGSIITAIDGQRVASVDDLVVRITRGAPGRLGIVGPDEATLSVVLPDGRRREVEMPMRVDAALP